MVKGIIEHIADDLKNTNFDLFLIENNDGFLYREDVKNALHTLGIDVVNGSNINQRIHFELKDEAATLVLLCKNNTSYLEDIAKQAKVMEFRLSDYFNGYHITSIIDLELELLDKLFSQKQLVQLNKQATQQEIERVGREDEAATLKPIFDLDLWNETLEKQLNEEVINWAVVCRIISKGLLETIDTPQVEELMQRVNNINVVFQEHIKESYEQTKSSSAVKKPQIVSKILDHLSFNYLNEKIALIIVDGLAYWQYELLKNILPANKNENVIFSWLPSITELSRQAIFRGNAPKTDYRQEPKSEDKLWKIYWKSKGISSHKVRYNHETINLDNLRDITKFAIVFKDLDEKIHGSSDYKDLLRLTENWIERSNISDVINKLQEEGFKIFLTSDHGNIQAKGWRVLNHHEKVGTKVTGSRSQRHLEYSNQALLDEFMHNNPELEDKVVKQDESIYFTSNLCFSGRETLVTHGGGHILEVLIPFIEIKNEQ